MAGHDSGAGGGASEDAGLMAAINVTPFVDVVLVLLVIFMVTAPLIAKDILAIRLPKTESSDGKGLSTLGVTVNREGRILLNGRLVGEQEMRDAVVKALSENSETQAIISADTETGYGNVVKAIDILKTAGLSRFAIQIERK